MVTTNAMMVVMTMRQMTAVNMAAVLSMLPSPAAAVVVTSVLFTSLLSRLSVGFCVSEASIKLVATA